MTKKGPKMAVFWPSRAEFCENQKKAWTFSYFYPREDLCQISENLAHQTWRKCVTNGRTDKRTDGRTDGTEIIGPSGKIPGTNEKECNCDGFGSISYVSNFFIRLKFAFEIFFLDRINFKHRTNFSSWAKD